MISHLLSLAGKQEGLQQQENLFAWTELGAINNVLYINVGLLFSSVITFFHPFLLPTWFVIAS